MTKSKKKKETRGGKRHFSGRKKQIMKQPTKKINMKATAFRLDEDIIPALKKIAKEQDRSVNWLVNNTLKNFIEGEKKKKKKKG